MPNNALFEKAVRITSTLEVPLPTSVGNRRLWAPLTGSPRDSHTNYYKLFQRAFLELGWELEPPFGG